MKQLFYDTQIKFEKTAMETELSDNAEQWQQEVASELYRQAPYVSNYATDIILDKVDPERGYAYGKATLKNKYDVPQPEKDNRSVNVPIIVRDKMLKPLDIYTYENKSYPLSEQRISQALFKNQPLEITDKKPSDKMMSYQMMPPTRSHMNSVVSNTGFGKYASEKSPLLDQILPTLSTEDVANFMNKISSDISLQQAYLDNTAFSNAVNKIAVSSHFTKQASYNEVSPTCIQLKKVSHNTFLIKTANVNAFNPIETELDINQVADEFIGDKAYKMPPGETLTGSSLGPIQVAKSTNIKPITSSGIYQVRDYEGKDLYGAVLPITDLAGQSTNETMFINPDVYSVQEKLAGVKVSNSIVVAESNPTGYGAFYDSNNRSITEPIDIKYTSHTPNSDDKTYNGFTRDGTKIAFKVSDLYKKLAHVAGNSYIGPSSLQWVPLPNKEVELNDSLKDNVSDFKNLNSTVEIRSTGDEFSLSGRPVEKIGNTQFLSKDDAEFILGTMGISSEKLAEAQKKKYLKVAGARTIIPISDVIKEEEKRASSIYNSFPWKLKKDLTKEAAVLQDEDTVDKVLSLGFLNPDNIKNFAAYLPELEKTTNKLADLLFASRCGLSTVPETAVESAMRNTDQILSGLRTLQEQESVKS